MEKGRRKAVLVVQKVILAFTLLFCFLILIGTVYECRKNLFSDLFPLPLWWILLLLLAAAICLLVVFFYHCVDHFSKRSLILASVIGFGIMAAVFVIFLCNFRCVPYTDALNVQDTALYFAETGSRELTEESGHFSYYKAYSNNNFLTILLAIYYKILLHFGISDIIVPSSILAAVGVMIAALFTYLIGVRIGGLKKGVKVLSLCVLNPLYYLLALWVYTNVISIPFMMGVLYFGICAWQARKQSSRILYSSLTLALAVTGYFIRATVLIPLIALLCCCVLLMIAGRKFIRGYAVGIVTGLLVGVLFFAGIDATNANVFSSVSEGNFPAVHWLYLGSHGTGQHNSEDSAFTQSFETKEEKSKALLQATIDNYKSYSIPELAAFMGRKLFTNWCYGDGGDLFDKLEEDSKQTSLNSWVLGQRNDLLRLYAYAFRLSTLVLICLALVHMLRSRRILTYPFLFALTFFGGILFYLFWEVKPIYSLPFIYLMLLLASEGGECAADNVTALREKLPKRKARWGIYALMAAALLFVCADSCSILAGTDISITNWTVKSARPNLSVGSITYDTDLILTQEFYASKPFSKIMIYAEADEEALEDNTLYHVTLENSGGKELYQGEFSAQDISAKSRVSFKVGTIIPDGKEKYVLTVRSEDPDQHGVIFRERNNSYIDMYPGRLTVNGEERNNDLWLRVYRKDTAAFCPLWIAVLLNGGLFILLCALLAWFFKSKKCLMKKDHSGQGKSLS